MLVLTRKQGQSIVIGDSIEIFVVEVRGDQIRLGIQAPRSVPVLRREVLDQIGTENREAALADTESISTLVEMVAPANGRSANASSCPGNDS
jgi:carbon storage regulator